MSASEIFSTSSLAEVLRSVLETKQTGYIKVRDGTHDGFVAVENGNILYARAGTDTNLPALFQFIGWREAKYEFQVREMPDDMSRDLAVYDPEVLIAGVAFKVEEATL